MVKDHLTLMATMSDHRQTLYELPTTHGRLTVADAIVLHRHQGLTKACCYVSAVDPWRFPADVDGHEVQSYLNVKRYVQQTVDQFTHTARKLSIYSDATEKNGGWKMATNWGSRYAGLLADLLGD